MARSRPAKPAPEVLREKKKHNGIKLLHRTCCQTAQAVKKAKQFAVRKLSRRLVAAKEKSDTGLVAKIEKHLAIVKEANHATIADEVAAKQLHTSDEPPSQSPEGGVGDGGDGINDVLDKQLKQAKCVQEVVAQVQDATAVRFTSLSLAQEVQSLRLSPLVAPCTSQLRRDGTRCGWERRHRSGASRCQKVSGKYAENERPGSRLHPKVYPKVRTFPRALLHTVYLFEHTSPRT
eukprot:398027-Prorocentrum_minimum.AAC.2